MINFNITVHRKGTHYFENAPAKPLCLMHNFHRRSRRSHPNLRFFSDYVPRFAPLLRLGNFAVSSEGNGKECRSGSEDEVKSLNTTYYDQQQLF